VARHDPTLDDIDQRFQKAKHMENFDVEIAKFVHWATDCFMDLMNRDPATKAELADWGLKMMKLERNRLQAYTTHIRKVIIDTGRILEVDTGTHSRPMFQALDIVAQVIERQLKERDHPIPAEFALVTISKAMPQLHQTVPHAMPLEKWSEWLHSIGLSDLGNILTERVSEALASAPAPPSTPDVASSAWLNNFGFNRPPSTKCAFKRGGAHQSPRQEKAKRSGWRVNRFLRQSLRQCFCTFPGYPVSYSRQDTICPWRGLSRQSTRGFHFIKDDEEKAFVV
jgi:hypothetical protein